MVTASAGYHVTMTTGYLKQRDPVIAVSVERTALKSWYFIIALISQSMTGQEMNMETASGKSHAFPLIPEGPGEREATKTSWVWA